MLDKFNRNNGVVKFILDIVRTILMIEIIGAILLSFIFIKILSVNEAIHQGICFSFATTNGGLDITETR